DLTASEAIRFQGTSFSGPGRVSADYELAVWSLSMRSGYMFAQAIALEGITGASFVSREMELESGVRSERDSDIFIGPLIGIAASVRASSWLSFEARTTQMLATAPPMSLGTTEIGAEMIPSPNLAVFAGWRWWEYEEEGLNINSDIELQMSGPTLGLRVRF
ncbi:MAG: hypothetical protein ACE5GW_10195, partial [Planctomycetota bacterium]